MHLRTSILMAALLAGTAAPALAQAGATTTQQDFEAATKLDDSGDHAGALAAWQKLEKRVSRKSLAIVQLRESRTLYLLNRLDEAAAMARTGLAATAAGDAALAGDRYLAYFTMAQAAEAALDYAGAADAYRQAEPLAPSALDRIAVLRGALMTDTFVDLAAAAGDSARIDQVMAGIKAEPKARAIIRSAQSVMLLNRKDFAGARTAAGDAVTLLGGLTTRTDLYDVAARSDYAIAALLAGDANSAREYMAMTGAGRLPNGEFDPGAQMRPPSCGGDAALKPEDAAVVQFSIDDAGRIIESVPIYAAGGGAAALEFARAVRDWSWTPAKVKALPPFFRYHARVELRCSTAFEAPSVATYLEQRLSDWFDRKDLPDRARAGSDAAALPGLKADLVTVGAAKGQDSIALLPILDALYTSSVVSDEDSATYARRALAIADTNHAPPLARLAIARVVWGNSGRGTRRYIEHTTAGLADPAFAGDPAARAGIHLLLADAERVSAPDRARADLVAVTTDNALEAGQPLRTAALIRLASLSSAQGDVAGARAAYVQSGLSAEQCSLVDSPPQLKSMGSLNTFPMEAAQWGFEGWTQVQYDVKADGKVAAPRAIVSYPPFVFTKAGLVTVAQMRYTPTYRPDGGVGCGGNINRVRFTMPH